MTLFDQIIGALQLLTLTGAFAAAFWIAAGRMR